MNRFFKSKARGLGVTVQPVVDVLSNILGFSTKGISTDGLALVLMLNDEQNSSLND